MARSVRPRTLAIAFGIYFLVIAYFAWSFGNDQTEVWYPGELSRWIYTTYMMVSAIFLVGLGGLAVTIRRSFTRQIRQLESSPGRGSAMPNSDALPPPLVETTTTKDHVDRDIDELLESLSEVEATAVRESQVIEGTRPPMGSGGLSASEVAARKARISARQKFLGRFVTGPGIVAATVLGISGIMLLGAGDRGFDETNFRLNTQLILGIGYSWLGIGAYIATTIAALVSSRDGGKK